MDIRFIGEADRATYLQMAAEFYASDAVLHPVPAHYFEITFEELMRSRAYAEGFILLTDKGEEAGYALISKMFSQEAGGMTAWMEEIYVRPAFQGQGLGKGFFEAFERLHPEMRRLRLEVEPDNEGAIRLYERLGFKGLGYFQMVKEKQ